jgi:Tfp pilus assembly protein PilX
MTHQRAPRRSETGSAYIVTLLALVVLTILALALTMVTQTEVQIGANEKTVNRSFYASDSALDFAASRVLTDQSYTPVTMILNQKTVGRNNTADRVRISSFVPILLVRCNWCPANEAGLPKFWNVQHATSTTSERISWNGTGSPPADATLLGQKTLSAMFAFEPWITPPVESLPEGDALKQVKF